MVKVQNDRQDNSAISTCSVFAYVYSLVWWTFIDRLFFAGLYATEVLRVSFRFDLPLHSQRLVEPAFMRDESFHTCSIRAWPYRMRNVTDGSCRRAPKVSFNFHCQKIKSTKKRYAIFPAKTFSETFRFFANPGQPSDVSNEKQDVTREFGVSKPSGLTRQGFPTGWRQWSEFVFVLNRRRGPRRTAYVVQKYISYKVHMPLHGVSSVVGFFVDTDETKLVLEDVADVRARAPPQYPGHGGAAK